MSDISIFSKGELVEWQGEIVICSGNLSYSNEFYGTFLTGDDKGSHFFMKCSEAKKSELQMELNDESN